MTKSHCCVTSNWGREFDAAQIEGAICENKLLTLELELDESGQFCPPAVFDGPNDGLTFEHWKLIVNQGCELGIKRIILKGRGEPLCRDWTLDLIRHIRSQECEVDLFTSGRLVSKELAEILHGLGIHVAVKLDVLDSAVLADLSGRGQPLEGSSPGLKNLLDAGYPGAENMLGIEVVAAKGNAANIPVLWRWARQNNIVPFIRRPSFFGGDGGKEGSEFSIEELKDLFEQLSEIDRRDFRKSWTPHPPLAGLECFRIRYSLSITAAGEVMPCLDMNLSIGNILRTPLETIVRRSAEFNQLRGISSRIKGYCRKCALTENCFGCRAAAYAFSGDFLDSDPYCWNRRMINEDHKKAYISDGLPHKDGMKLIDGTALLDKKKIKIHVTVPGDGIFISPGGRLAPLALVEMLAQLCAVQQAHEKNTCQGQVVRGYLVGMDNIKFAHPVFSGDELDLTAWKSFEMEAIHKVQGEIFRGEKGIGQAELTLFEADEWPALPEIVEPEKREAAVISDDAYPWIEEKDRVAREILQSVFRLSRKSGEALEATLFFRPGFICFSGHFPHYPILPAIVFVYAGWLLAEIDKRAKLDLVCVRKGKFLKPVHPYDSLFFELKQVKGKNEKMVWYSVLVNSSNEVAARYELGMVTNGEGE